MGIKNLNKFIRNNCPDVFEEIHISQYSYKKIAIDISLYLCKFKSICGDRWLTAFINLVTCLRKYEVHCIFVYDGKALGDKDEEKKKRAEQREKTEDKITKLEIAMEHCNLTGEVDQILIDLYKKKTKDMERPKRMMKKNPSSPSIQIDLKFLENVIKKMRSQVLDISESDFKLTRDLFDILNIPYTTAPTEAECFCSYLCIKGHVDGVLSEDTDVMCYKAPVFLSKINTSDGTCTRVKYEDLLESLGLTCDQFLDQCIMCGTDYNKNIFRVGPETSYKLIQQHGSIEGIENNTKHDTSILKHQRVRELFRIFDETCKV